MTRRPLRSTSSQQGSSTGSVSAAVAPVRALRGVMATAGTDADLAAENARLKAENERLNGWEWRARELEQRLAALTPLAKVIAEQPVGFVTARVLAETTGPFAQSATIAAGVNQGLRAGQPVMDAGGLVGRVVEVGVKVSQVLLVSDLQSRIPVEIGPGRTRAIMIGDNSRAPRLAFLPRGQVPAAGEAVATSGVGGGLPKGLRVGRVSAAADGVRVGLAAQTQHLDYVSVLLVETSVAETGEHRITSGEGSTDAIQGGQGRALRRAPAPGEQRH